MRLRACLFVLSAVALASCRSPFTNVWEEPDWQGAPLQRVLVVGAGVDAATRRVYEDAMSARLEAAGVAAEPSHRAVPDAITLEAVADAINAGGHDAMIAARLIGVDDRPRYVPGSQPGMGRMHRARWRGWDGFSTGTWRIDRVARVETQVWSLADEGTLIWAGSSEAVNPRDIPSTARSLADDTVTALQRAGFLNGD